MSHAVATDVVRGGGRLIVNEEESRRVQDIFAFIHPAPFAFSGGRGTGPTAVEDEVLDLAKWNDARGPRLLQAIVTAVAH